MTELGGGSEKGEILQIPQTLVWNQMGLVLMLRNKKDRKDKRCADKQKVERLEAIFGLMLFPK